MPSRRKLPRRAALLCLACPVAGRASAEAAGPPFGFAAHGAFRDLVQRRDYAPKIELAALDAAGVTEAVGALSGLRGEVTLIEGRRVVSLGPCPDCGKAPDSACLLAAAKVARWQARAVPADVPAESLRGFIAAEARAAGLDPARPFPFRFSGSLTAVAMHVHGRPNPGFTGHGSSVPMADGDSWLHARLDGEVVGFHASADMVGVISHAGDPLHCHWVSPGRERTAHLDAFGLAAGGRLLMPVV
jgi:hypothetical protein